MEYRDLCIETATHGQFRAHMIRITLVSPAVHEPDRTPEAGAAR